MNRIFAFQIRKMIHRQRLNASKRYSIAEHLFDNSICANTYNIDRFKIIKTCTNIFVLIKLEAICILLRKPVLCKQKDFDYTVYSFFYTL